MERDISQAFCRCGCGFYGNPATDGMCSKCFKDAMKRKQAPPASSSTSSSTNISNQISNALSNSLSESNASTMVRCEIASLAALIPEKKLEQIDKQNFTDESKVVKLEQDATVKLAEKELLDTNNESSAGKSETPSDAPKIVKKKKTRCTKCKINVGCIGFPCRCGGIFCATHRYANEHSCTFDYKEHGAEEIRKNNPQVVGEKIQKI